MKQALNERILLVLAIFAFLSIVTGMIYHPRSGWMEGVSIYVAVFILVVITSLNDWAKDKQFVKLQSLAKDQDIATIRGKANQFQTINMWDLVVGDVVQLQAGDKIPADCLFLSGSNVKTQKVIGQHVEDSESQEFKEVKKDFDSDPFLFADHYLVSGTCRAIVVCVGPKSSRKDKEEKIDTDSSTELEKKLQTLSKSFTFIGIIAALIILITSITILCIQTGVDEEVGGKVFMKKLTEQFTLAIIIVMVAIPEGLPMTITISLAFSVIRMYEQDNVLVRDLESPEKMGQVTDLCIGKTGTLTTEEMTVEYFWLQKSILNSRKNTIHNCHLQPFVKELMVESVCYNNRAHIEMNENAFYIPKGNGTDVSLLKWLQEAEIPVHEYVSRKHDLIVGQAPFDPISKREVVAFRNPDIDGIRVLIKGSPESVLASSQAFLDISGNVDNLDSKNKGTFDREQDKWCEKGLRVIGFAYRDLTQEQWEELKP